jgi:predicted NUDIX family phosphoesterase
MKRGSLEGNKNFKHLISYFIVFDPFNKKILSYQRTSHSGEQRLVGNKSIGWGGHIGFNDFRDHIDYRIEDDKIDSISNNG